MVVKIRLALFDNDGYMSSLVRYLCNKWKGVLETRVFTDIDVLKKYVHKGQVDVLLATEDAKDDVKDLKDQIPQLLFFAENKKSDSVFDCPMIFKYQSAAEIVKEIFALVAENENIPYSTGIISKKTAEMISGYAPFGGGGITEFLFRKAKELSTEYRILYVNLEEFHSFFPGKKEIRGESEQAYRGMSEVLFYLRRKKAKLALKLESIVYRKENLDCIFAVEDYRDLHSITKEDMAALLQVLAEQTEYEKIFFDIGYICEATIYLMEECHEIYMPRPRREMQISKEKAFIRNLTRAGKENILDKRKYFVSIHS